MQAEIKGTTMPILEVSLDPQRLDQLPVNEYVDLYMP